MQRCQEEGVGWLAWSWGAVGNADCGGGNRSAYDMTTDGKMGNWAGEYGKEIVTGTYGITATSVRPQSLLDQK